MSIRRWPRAWSAIALATSMLLSPIAASASPVSASLLDIRLPHPNDTGVRRTLPKQLGSSASKLPSELTTGVVLIDTVINYIDGEAAGSGFILSSDGIIVTNHHVVAGSTDVKVTIASTGQKLEAEVLGYDITEDVAVLKLPHLTGLSTVQTNTDPVTIGQSITAVGNSMGGGELLSYTGLITGTGVTITVSDDGGAAKSVLRNLIQISAPIVPGDSGGPLFNFQGQVVGMNVAGAHDVTDNESYCIPITTVLAIEQSVLAGVPNSPTVTIGRPAGLGIGVSPAAGGGVQVDWVYPHGAADKAGITKGSTLSSIDGKAISSADQLSQLLDGYTSGTNVAMTWTDAAGKQHSATVTLGNGPLP